MSYISLGDKDKKEMLERIGIRSLDELFQTIPDEVKLKRELRLPSPLSEPELVRHFEEIGKRNKFSRYLSFLGGGAYPHFIPYLVDYLSSRGEFISPYTPYQPEVSQGTLQIIFEFQTLISQLTGMDIANASLYDGASGAAEAVLMANRINGKQKVLVARTLHPQYREVIKTYIKNLAIKSEEISYASSGEMDFEDLSQKLDGETAAVVCQSPNFLGVVENLKKLVEASHAHQALFIVVVAEALSLSILQAPGKLGVDIVSGEGQSFGLPLSFGGPFLGFMACAKEFVRQMPGRLAGETLDAEGKRGFVLTLSTREQHIRRERATSNICTNEAWCALRAAIFLETLGLEGLRELSLQNIQKTNYALKKLSQIKGVKRKFSGNFFNEFVLEFSKEWEEIDRALREKGIIPGLALRDSYPELRNCALFCVTEMHKKEEIDRLVEALGGALK